MHALIEWLITLEHQANEFYRNAAAYFSADPKLQKFLQHLAEDEAEHYHIISSAAHYLSAFPPRGPGLLIDEAIKEKIEAPFRAGREQLQQQTITKESVLAITVDSEISEWNDLFLYVLNTLKNEEKIFEMAALRIENHVRHIDHYLRDSAYGREKLDQLAKIPYVKKLNTLVVDDDAPLAELIARMLEEICVSDLARNGLEALKMLEEKSYDLIISDVDMPLMNGLDFYRKAAEKLIQPNDIFLFHTGNLQKRTQIFFDTNKITYLTKPSSILELRETVMKKYYLHSETVGS